MQFYCSFRTTTNVLCYNTYAACVLIKLSYNNVVELY